MTRSISSGPDSVDAGLVLAGSVDELATAAARAFRQMVHRHDEVSMAELTEDGSYRVLASSTPRTEGLAGRIPHHPILSHLDDLSRPASIRSDDRRLHSDLTRHLQAAKVRETVYLPLIAADRLLGCVLILRRGRIRRPIAAKARVLVEALAATLLRFRVIDDLARADEQERSAAEATTLLVTVIRGIDRSRSVDEAIGHLLRAATGLDRALTGAIVGRVVGGVVVGMAATGTTPRTSVHALEGTRLEGFPIGRQLLAQSEPIFATADEVSHGTRSLIMEPIGAASMLAAAGRDGGVIRLVLSAYRSETEAPPSWALSALEVALDGAAQAVGRLERDARLGTLTSSLEDGVLVYGSDGHLTHRNRAAQDLLGSSSENAVSTGYTSVSGDQISDGDDPVSRALKGRDSRAVLRATATGRLHRVTAAPLDDGGAVVVIRDVTDEPDAHAPEAEVRDIATGQIRRTP